MERRKSGSSSKHPPLLGGQARSALDDLFSTCYEELRRRAAYALRSESHVSLSPTALVNEAWLRLARSAEFAPMSESHFKRLAARAMRHILIDAARQRSAAKRSIGMDFTVVFDDAFSHRVADGSTLLALDAALDKLAELDARRASMVEIRFFGGMDVAEAAAVLGVSEATVHRDWRAVRAWLVKELASSA